MDVLGRSQQVSWATLQGGGVSLCLRDEEVSSDVASYAWSVCRGAAIALRVPEHTPIAALNLRQRDAETASEGSS